MKKITKLSAAALAAVMLFSTFILTASAKDNQLIAAFSFDSTGKTTGAKLDEYAELLDDNAYPATEGDGKLSCSVSGVDNRKLEWSKAEYGTSGTDIVPLLSAGTNNPWGAAPYIQIKVATLGMTDIRLTINLAGSKKAPAEWKLQYSTDNKETFTDVNESTITINADSRKLLTPYFSEFALPAACEGAEELFIRIIAASTTTIGGSDTTLEPTGGEIALNNITVTGVGSGEPSSSSATEPTSTVAEPSSTAPSGTTYRAYFYNSCFSSTPCFAVGESQDALQMTYDSNISLWYCDIDASAEQLIISDGTDSGASVTIANPGKSGMICLVSSGADDYTAAWYEDISFIIGDADNDNTVNIKDATTIQKYAAFLVNLNDKAYENADVDISGEVNIKDATAIQKYCASIETGYNIGIEAHG